MEKTKESSDIMEITFKELSLNEIDLVKPLWQKLNKHHIQCSEFREEFKQTNFEKRINKIKDNKLKIMKVMGFNVPLCCTWA
ncbi:MAG: hypothetical protein FH762_18455 [Firmicutes bacterium]|nr:hypothetical protein [Bacillota bacterium]